MAADIETQQRMLQEEKQALAAGFTVQTTETGTRVLPLKEGNSRPEKTEVSRNSDGELLNITGSRKGVRHDSVWSTLHNEADLGSTTRRFYAPGWGHLCSNVPHIFRAQYIEYVETSSSIMGMRETRWRE